MASIEIIHYRDLRREGDATQAPPLIGWTKQVVDTGVDSTSAAIPSWAAVVEVYCSVAVHMLPGDGSQTASTANGIPIPPGTLRHFSLGPHNGTLTLDFSVDS